MSSLVTGDPLTSAAAALPLVLVADASGVETSSANQMIPAAQSNAIQRLLKIVLWRIGIMSG
jgi:hypothetical protein